MRRKQGSRRAPSTTLAALLVLAEWAGRSSAESSCAEVNTLAGSGSYAFADGTGAAASFKSPRGVAYSPSGTHIAVGDFYNHRVRLIEVATQIERTRSLSETSVVETQVVTIVPAPRDLLWGSTARTAW